MRYGQQRRQRRLRKVADWYLGIVTTILLLTVYWQGNTIETLTHNQIIETTRASTQSKDIALLRRELNLHLDANKRLEQQLDFLSQQSDVLTAAFRSGRSGHKVMEAWYKELGL